MTGYQMIDDSRYLFSDDGIMQTGRYTDENGDTYCFTDDIIIYVKRYVIFSLNNII